MTKKLLFLAATAGLLLGLMAMPSNVYAQADCFVCSIGTGPGGCDECQGAEQGSSQCAQLSCSNCDMYGKECTFLISPDGSALAPEAWPSDVAKLRIGLESESAVDDDGAVRRSCDNGIVVRFYAEERKAELRTLSERLVGI